MRALRYPLALAFVSLAACADDGGSSEQASIASKKLAARAAMEAASSESRDSPVSSPVQDPCAREGWYDDGSCDYWCPKGDAADCASSGGDIACDAFFSPADGKCDESDPCGPFQDEDCQKGGGSSGHPGDLPGCIDPGTGGGMGGDGKCEPTSFAEFKSDPDCANIVCPAIFSPADGVCNAKSACDWVIDEDCSDQGGVACIEIQYATNGKCEAAPGCAYTDPEDCAVICPAIAYEKNGKCEAAMGCENSDPDC